MSSSGNTLALVVDDDATSRLLAREMLESSGFEVEEVAAGEQALQRFDARPADIVVLDVELPDLDGYQLCERIRQHRVGQYVPIVMLTGHDDVVSIQRAYQAGATDFVTKPVPWLVLQQRVAYVLRASRAFADLRANRAQLADAQRIAMLGNWEVDLESRELRGSAEFRRIHHLPPDPAALTLDDWLERVDQEHREGLAEVLQESVHREAGFAIDHGITDDPGAGVVVHTQANPDASSGKSGGRICGVSQDVTERKRSERQIHFLAYHDELTGLGNQRHFREHLDRAIRDATRRDTRLALMLLDLDDLKRVNETLGHGSGDALIQAAATRLADSVRASDLVARTIDSRPDASVARLGGDEFTILLGSVREGRDAAKVANRIQEAFSKPFVVRGEELIVGTSIGVAIWPSDGSTREELIRNADAAMRHAKQQGGSQLQFYDQSMNAAALHRLRIEGALRRALASNELDAHYQPKVAMASGRICGFEALVRWPKPDGGYVSPAEFVPVAEESGLISKLGVFMLRRACAKAFEWRAAGLGSLPISVNVSPKQFADEGLVDSVASVLAEARIEPAMLELEITESALVHNAVAAETALQRFREMGVGIALDDFGTGYSSLTFLRRFAVDAIKIDRSFVSGIGKSSDDEAIVSAVISMAKALRKQVVAEGVETVEQRAFLKGQGCDQEQGYLFSPPRPPDAIEALLREMQSSS